MTTHLLINISELTFASVSTRVFVGNHSYENEFHMHVHFHANQTHFHFLGKKKNKIQSPAFLHEYLEKSLKDTGSERKHFFEVSLDQVNYNISW